MSGFITGRTSLTTVNSGDIADDAVTLAKMATGTDGELITWDASGDPAAVAVGTATHVLTSNGAGVAPTFQAVAAGGAWNLIGTSVASTSASLTITGLDSTYDTYAISISDFVATSANPNLWMRFGDSSGIDSGGSDYKYHAAFTESTSSAYGSGTASNGTDKIIVHGGNIGADAGESLCVTGWINRPGDGSGWPRIHGTWTGDNTSATGASGGGAFWGCRTAVITLDRIQVYFSYGNIASGRITVWGISHA